MITRVSRVVGEYALLVGVPILGVLAALQAGLLLTAPPPGVTAGAHAAGPAGPPSLPLLLLSVAVLVACARVAASPRAGSDSRR